ncbi:MAG: DUF2177 family protein [Bacteriovoracaceae bacterium]|nr:DUF2177 family protein [Bacteriovoracaceae bacterium]
MKVKLLIYFLSVILFIILDIAWFNLVTGDTFYQHLNSIARIQNNSIDVAYLPALLVYLLLALGINIFVLSSKKVVFYGATFGLVTYGIYDFTNAAILTHWPSTIIIIDVGWGIVSCALVSYLVNKLKLALNK